MQAVHARAACSARTLRVLIRRRLTTDIVVQTRRRAACVPLSIFFSRRPPDAREGARAETAHAREAASFPRDRRLGRPALSRFFATTNNLAPPAFLVVDSAKSASGSFVHCFNQQLCAEDPRPMAEGACLKP